MEHNIESQRAARIFSGDRRAVKRFLNKAKIGEHVAVNVKNEPRIGAWGTLVAKDPEKIWLRPDSVDPTYRIPVDRKNITAVRTGK